MSFRLGVVMLNTGFPRPPGDIGNPATFRFPVVYLRVLPATVEAVVRKGEVSPDAVAGLRAAVLELAEQEKVSAIATSCGFLGALQAELQAGVSVPVISSAFALLPFLREVYGAEALLGVLTFDSRRLSRRHLGPWAAPQDEWALEFEGVEQGEELHRVITGDLPDLDLEKAEADVLAAGRRLVERAPKVVALLLECTNLSPYRAALAASLGRPVYDLNQMISWLAVADAIRTESIGYQSAGPRLAPR